VKPLLIFDLDETLIYFDLPSYTEHIPDPPDYFAVGYVGWLRPHAKEIVRELAEHYELAAWSSASMGYIVAMFNETKLFEGVELSFVWDSMKCTLRRCWDEFPRWPNINQGDQYYVKKLSKVAKLGYNIERMLIVDDSPEKAEENLGNLVSIRSWQKQDGDVELLALRDYLISIKDVPNFRALDKRNWRNR
jgi:RNA polymerase II subunit A small phosphatase-like protein